MPRIIIKKLGWNCLRCNHDWIPKEGFNEKDKPITCPKCKSPYWDKPKREKK